MAQKVKLYNTTDGFIIMVGMDDASNDELSLKIAHPMDLWFHVNGTPGSHVLLCCGESKSVPAKDSITQAAAAAAWFSKMRNAGKVSVHYCHAKNVSKPKGAKPGTVSIRKIKKIVVKPEQPKEEAEE